jgi:hypothetical protein
MKKRLFLLVALFPLSAAASTLYKCTDESGVVLYTNQKTAKKNCTVLSVQVPPAPKVGSGGTARAGNSAPRAAANPSPSDFPRVSSNEQKARDTDRRAILERELASEQSSLEKAKQALGANPTQAAQAPQMVRDTVTLHERNIAALNKELSKLR